MAQRTFRADFGNTNDADLDAKLSSLEDGEHTIEEIKSICRRYGVWARVINSDTGLLVAEIERDGGQVAPRF